MERLKMKGLRLANCKFRAQNFMRKYIFCGYDCLICGKEVPKLNECGICEDCEPNVIFNDGKRCEKCGAPLLNEADYCLTCQNNERVFLKAYSPLLFKGDIRELVLAVKYGAKQHAFFKLSEYLFKEIEDKKIEFDIIVYVPQYLFSVGGREINLSKRFAETVAGKLKIPLFTGLSAKSNDVPRHLLKGEERRKNFEHRFKLKNKEVLCGKRVLIIDDIITTGTTANSVALALMRAKPKDIQVLTLCH